MSAYPQQFQLRLLSQSENLELIRDFVARVATRAGFNETDVNKIELAVDEACANVIKHAYQHDAAHQPLELLIEIDLQKFTVLIMDQGVGFDVRKIKPVNMNEYLAEMRIGGLGIYLIKTLMDEVDFKIQPGVHNEVKLVKYFVKENGALLTV